MEADSNNDGWYYCWIPETTNNIIINANDAAVQTSDYKLESKNAWVTVTDAENVEISYDAQTTGDLPEYVEKFKIHAQVPDDWQDVCLWAWSAPDGKNAFEAWPGKTMSKGEDGWYTASAPVWVNSIIVNGNSGDVQTENISIDAAEVWVTVSEDGTSDFTYNDPNAPVAEDITVHVKAPADWSEPHLWAWSAPDGTNAFSSWPGEALQEGEDGWLTLSVPGWVNSIIVNGSDGSVQLGVQDNSRIYRGDAAYLGVVPEGVVLGIAADEELEFVAAFKNDLYNENLTLTMIAGQNPFAEGETQLQMTRSYG